MKVYITYKKDKYGSYSVDKVFAKEIDVKKYVITKAMINDSETPEELEKKAKVLYEIHKVIVN